MELELSNAIWLFVVIFMLHDFEEIITVEQWSNKYQHKVTGNNIWIKKKIRQFWNLNSNTFAKRDVIIFIMMCSITFIKIQFLHSSWSSILYLSFVVFVLIHNIAHVLQTLVLKAYTPGLYTAILLVTPYTIYLLGRML
ncbi:HXXEE domain-containing protein [Cytobacillus sp. IB215665]|uniref:HXXEE domain-containing protein n=1 Tax=Cytobacillus sp. IB215665 TaxID=3097357 RepID=UPI002A154ADA|nr:HXXEE domain-containing protein [Cytobacillus sp. IB215665]MDX8365568.1 HXXEE domain-containing protein [Cytobacillus sp. IB215665]